MDAGESVEALEEFVLLVYGLDVEFMQESVFQL